MTIRQGLTCGQCNHLMFNSLRHDTSVRRLITTSQSVCHVQGEQDQPCRELSAVQGMQQDPYGNGALVPKGASIAGTGQRNL